MSQKGQQRTCARLSWNWLIASQGLIRVTVEKQLRIPPGRVVKRINEFGAGVPPCKLVSIGERFHEPALLLSLLRYDRIISDKTIQYPIRTVPLEDFLCPRAGASLVPKLAVISGHWCNRADEHFYRSRIPAAPGFA